MREWRGEWYNYRVKCIKEFRIEFPDPMLMTLDTPHGPITKFLKKCGKNVFCLIQKLDHNSALHAKNQREISKNEVRKPHASILCMEMWTFLFRCFYLQRKFRCFLSLSVLKMRCSGTLFFLGVLFPFLFKFKLLSYHRTSSVTYLSWKCNIAENNFRIHLIPIRHFYGVQFLNKSVKSFVIFHQLFQSAEETFFTIIK